MHYILNKDNEVIEKIKMFQSKEISRFECLKSLLLTFYLFIYYFTFKIFFYNFIKLKPYKKPF